MGFIYSKPMSIEEVFSKFDTDRDGKISKKEAKNAKKLDILTSFNVEKGMTLQTFESKNTNIFAQYERAATDAYNKQQSKVKYAIKSLSDILIEMHEYELEELDEFEKEIEQEKEEIEKKLYIQKEAKALGINLSSEELTKLSPESLLQLVNNKKMLKECFDE